MTEFTSASAEVASEHNGRFRRDRQEVQDGNTVELD